MGEIVCNVILTRRLGQSQIFCGLLLLGLGVIVVAYRAPEIVNDNHWVRPTGVGIWLGPWLIISGFVGITSAHFPESSGLNSANLFMNIISISAESVAGVFIGIAIEFYATTYMTCTSYPYSCRDKGALGIYAAMAALTLIEWLGSFAGIVCCCYGHFSSLSHDFEKQPSGRWLTAELKQPVGGYANIGMLGQASQTKPHAAASKSLHDATLPAAENGFVSINFYAKVEPAMQSFGQATSPDVATTFVDPQAVPTNPHDQTFSPWTVPTSVGYEVICTDICSPPYESLPILHSGVQGEGLALPPYVD